VPKTGSESEEREEDSDERRRSTKESRGSQGDVARCMLWLGLKIPGAKKRRMNEIVCCIQSNSY